MTEKYGFIYVWRDRKRKMFYVGCHWGNEHDGYVCSSRRMREVYARRPEDFRRRVVQRVYTSRTDLLEAEFNWLKLIPKNELGRFYYNLNNHHFGHWSTTDRKQEIAEQTASKNRGRKASDETRAKQSAALKGKNAGKVRSPEARQKMSESRKGRSLSPEHKAAISASLKESITPELIEARASKQRGRNHTDASRQKMSEAAKGKPKSDTHRAAISAQMAARKGQPKSETWKKAMAGRVWVNNGIINKRMDPKQVPEGWNLGRI